MTSKEKLRQLMTNYNFNIRFVIKMRLTNEEINKRSWGGIYDNFNLRFIKNNLFELSEENRNYNYSKDEIEEFLNYDSDIINVDLSRLKDENINYLNYEDFKDLYICIDDISYIDKIINVSVEL